MDKFQPVSFEKSLAKALKDPEFKKEYDALELEYSIITQVIRKRLEKVAKALGGKLQVSI